MTARRVHSFVLTALSIGLAFGVLAVMTVGAQEDNGTPDPSTETPTVEPPQELLPTDETEPADETPPDESSDPTEEAPPVGETEPTEEAPDLDETEPADENLTEELELLDESALEVPALTEQPMETEESLPEVDLAPVQVQSEPVLNVSIDVTSSACNDARLWDIEKRVEPTAQSAIAGDTVQWLWTVDLHEYSDGENCAVEGTVRLTNLTAEPIAASFGVSLEPYGWWVFHTGCDGLEGNDPDNLTILAGETVTCTFYRDYVSEEVNQSVVTVYLSDGQALQASDDFAFIHTVTNGTAIVNDDQEPDFDQNGGLVLVASEDWWGTWWSWDELQSYTCSTDEADYGASGSYTYIAENTATVMGSDGYYDEAYAATEVTCYAPAAAPDVTVTVDAYLEREHMWSVSSEPDGSYSLAFGETVSHTFTVTAELTNVYDGVFGTIIIANPGPMDVSLLSVKAVAEATGGLSQVHSYPVDCGDTLIVPAGQSLTCSFAMPFYDQEFLRYGESVTAIVTGVAGGAWTMSGTTALDPTPKYDNWGVVQVENPNVPESQYWIADHETTAWEHTKVFECPADTRLWVGGTYSYDYWDDVSLPTDEDYAVVYIECYGLVENCTLGTGYWQTHASLDGPAPLDYAWWALGAYNTFFLSGQSYYDVIQMVPAGNAYYILAAQYIATELNFLNGADPSAAQAAFDEATDLFNTYSPADIAALKSNDPVRKQFVALAETLERYNTGRIGPGRCKG